LSRVPSIFISVYINATARGLHFHYFLPMFYPFLLLYIYDCIHILLSTFQTCLLVFINYRTDMLFPVFYLFILLFTYYFPYLFIICYSPITMPVTAPMNPISASSFLSFYLLLRANILIHLETQAWLLICRSKEQLKSIYFILMLLSLS